MRIFVSDVRAQLDSGEDRSALVRKLLAYAVKKVWGSEMPEIVKDEKGKPYFLGDTGMHFSLSHTKRHVLAAVSDHAVGADIEMLRPIRGGFERLFSPEMLADFGYFGGWTLREAVFKLQGEGELRCMDIRLLDGEIVSPYAGVKCRRYDMDGCAIAVAAWDGNFPDEVELVEAERFCQESA